MSKKPDLAPNACIVCGEPAPKVDAAQSWIYIAGSKPAGAMVCSNGCLAVAVRRQTETGRVDVPFGTAIEAS